MSFAPKKYSIAAGIAGAVALCSLTSSPADPKSGYSNLKVLPRNISSKALQSIMIDDFEDGLGVGCSFCHAGQKGSHRLDYSSDAKPEKEITRIMMRMTIKLNSKYFKAGRHPMIGNSSLVISCATCHRGQPRP